MTAHILCPGVKTHCSRCPLGMALCQTRFTSVGAMGHLCTWCYGDMHGSCRRGLPWLRSTPVFDQRCRCYCELRSRRGRGFGDMWRPPLQPSGNSCLDYQGLLFRLVFLLVKIECCTSSVGRARHQSPKLVETSREERPRARLLRSQSERLRLFHMRSNLKPALYPTYRSKIL